MNFILASIGVFLVTILLLGGYFVGSQEVFVSERKREYYHQRG